MSPSRTATSVEDDYFWLRERDNPEVLAYLAAEDAYATSMMSGTAGLQDTLYREMLGRIKETDEERSLPRVTATSTTPARRRESSIPSMPAGAGA